MAAGRRLGRLGGTAGDGGAPHRREHAVRRSEYSRWNSVLDSYINGDMKSNAHMTVFEHTPAVLRELGAPDLPINIDKDILDKITGIVKTRSGTRHSIPASELRGLQIELDNPIAVFDSKTRDDSLVVLTRIVDRENNEKAVVALHLDKSQGAIEVNDIASAYGKDKQSIENWTAWRLLRYVNKQARKSSAKWLQLPPDSDLRAHHVLTEKDFQGEKLGEIVADDGSGVKGSDEKRSSAVSEEGAAQREYDGVVARYTNPDGTRKAGWMKAPNGKPTSQKPFGLKSVWDKPSAAIVRRANVMASQKPFGLKSGWDTP